MSWRAGERPARALAVVLSGMFGAYAGLYLIAALGRSGPFRFGDFFALWSYGRILAAHPATELYDPVLLKARQVALGMAASGSNPFPYPPSFLPVVWPLGGFSYDTALAGFMAVTVGLYALAVAAAGRPRLPLALLAVILPTSTVTLIAGQAGFLTGALLLGGMALLPTRQIAGGVLLGLLACKPQLGPLVPVALIAARQWRALAAGAATVLLTALATSAAFGWHIWADWLAYLPDYEAQFQRESGDLLPIMPTLTANLRMLGVAPVPTRLAQAAAAGLAALWVWRAYRGQGPTPRGLLVLASATLLATPHAFIYDMPALGGAVLLFAADRVRQAGVFSTAEVFALTLALVLPVLMLKLGAGVPLSTACLLPLVAVLVAHLPPAAAPAVTRARPAGRS